MAWLLLAVLAAGMGLARAEDAFSGHVLLDGRKRGACGTFTGDVEVLAVFVDLPEAPWTEDARTETLTRLEEALTQLQADAKRHGAELTLSVSPFRAFAGAACTMESGEIAKWAAGALETTASLPAYEEGMSKYASRPVVFLQNIEGRAFACREYGSNTAEFVTVFSSTSSASMRHELLHLFGASDFYYVDVTEALARSLFPDSIMLDAETECRVDDVTAYAVGWTEAPSETAQVFLAATAHLTEADVKENRSAAVQTGFGETEAEEYVYTGGLQSGIAHGIGQIRWHTGSCYTGSISNGVLNGLGVYQWPNGQVFAGQWQNGVRTGMGAYEYPDGGHYAGGFREGTMDGCGVYAWSDGTLFAGEWEMGNRTGLGTLSWPDGGMLMGSFVGGVLHGKGIQVWPDGSVYTGDWVNGVRTGTGVMQWADGNAYSGAFADGHYHGWGVLTRPDGTSLYGWWENGLYAGEQPPQEE